MWWKKGTLFILAGILTIAIGISRSVSATDDAADRNTSIDDALRLVAEDGIDLDTARALKTRAEGQEEFVRNSPEGAPAAWAVFRDDESTTIVVSGYWRTEYAGGETGTVVAALYDEATGKYVNGIVRQQKRLADGTWLQSLTDFTGRVINAQEVDEPETAYLGENGEIGIMHGYKPCKDAGYAECQATFNDCVAGCAPVCDGQSPAICSLCRADCTLERIGCRAGTVSYCIYHANFGH